MVLDKRMRVRIEPAEQNDIAINRVRDALKKYAPEDIEFIEDHAEFNVDLLVMMVNGRCGRTKRRLAMAKKFNADIAVMQIALITTRNPDVRDWLPVWDEAALIWSYYDLPQIALEQGVEPTFAHKCYRAPLGADAEVFKPSGAEKEYLAITVTKGYLTESTREVLRAARRAGGEVAYVGPPTGIGWVHEFHNITDEELADLYSKSHYVCALRRNEGQDLPAAEGLLCGARPVVFNRPDQADWYGEFSIVLDEIDKNQIEADLVKVFQSEYEPVTPKEIARGRYVFSWRRFAGGFWDAYQNLKHSPLPHP
jgi:hypothetical protein